MKNLFIALIFTVGANLSLNGQSIQKEINEQVWIPFIKSFSTNDTDGFMALHSKDVIRSPRDSRQILGWQEYYSQMKRNAEVMISGKLKTKIELRFTERIAKGDKAIEVGIYKTTQINQDGTSLDYFGRFHVVLRKENFIWKILVDTDYSEENSIGEKQFLKGVPLE